MKLKSLLVVGLSLIISSSAFSAKRVDYTSIPDILKDSNRAPGKVAVITHLQIIEEISPNRAYRAQDEGGDKVLLNLVGKISVSPGFAKDKRIKVGNVYGIFFRINGVSQDGIINGNIEAIGLPEEITPSSIVTAQKPAETPKKVEAKPQVAKPVPPAEPTEPSKPIEKKAETGQTQIVEDQAPKRDDLIPNEIKKTTSAAQGKTTAKTETQAATSGVAGSLGKRRTWIYGIFLLIPLIILLIIFVSRRTGRGEKKSPVPAYVESRKEARFVRDEGVIASTREEISTRVLGQSEREGWSKYSGHESRIVFERHGDAGWLPLGIFAINPDGTNCVQILSTRTGAAPEWSPDGTWIAFQEVPQGYESYATNIHIMRPNGEEIRQITSHKDGAAACPTWSPDSGRIAYCLWKDGVHQVWTVDINRLHAEQIAFEGSNGYPVWTPSNEILFQKEDASPSRIFITSPDGRNQRQCNLFQDDDQEPMWSRDGNKIVFVRNGGICVMNSDGGNLQTIPGATGVVEVSWSPDGNKIVYSCSSRTSGHEIYVIDLDGQNQVKIVENPFGPNQKEVGSCDVCWSPLLRSVQKEAGASDIEKPQEPYDSGEAPPSPSSRRLYSTMQKSSDYCKYHPTDPVQGVCECGQGFCSECCSPFTQGKRKLTLCIDCAAVLAKKKITRSYVAAGIGFLVGIIAIKEIGFYAPILYAYIFWGTYFGWFYGGRVWVLLAKIEFDFWGLILLGLRITVAIFVGMFGGGIAQFFLYRNIVKKQSEGISRAPATI